MSGTTVSSPKKGTHLERAGCLSLVCRSDKVWDRQNLGQLTPRAEEMTYHDQDRERVGLFWPMVLAAGICLMTAGCGWAPGLDPGPIGPGGWTLSKPRSETETEAFKRKVEADSFPTAAATGL